MGRALILVLILVALRAPAPACAQRGCEKKTATVAEITIAGDDEAGERLVVEGIVMDDEGQPVAGATVYVYHTDVDGYYALPGNDPSVSRLCGLMLTGEDGRYRFRTIYPASYPGGAVPRHIHYVVSGPGIETAQFLLEFTDDPLITESRIQRDRRRHEGLEPTYHGIRPLTRDAANVLICTRNLLVSGR